MHLPLVLPPVVTGWLLLLVFGVQGPVGALLLDWFGVRLAFTSAGAALACGVMVFPLMVRAMRLVLRRRRPGVGAGGAHAWAPGGSTASLSITLPLAAPGVLVGGVLGFAACLGEFGAVITFAANIPGQTRTLPLAIYAALQAPGGEARRRALALVSLLLALGGLAACGVLGRRLAQAVGR